MDNYNTLKFLYFDSNSQIDTFNLEKVSVNNKVLSDKINIPYNNDLIPGKYEGGIKIWECAIDLLLFLQDYLNDMQLLNKEKLQTTKTLELGCGHGFPGLQMMTLGSETYLQDYNKEVLDDITIKYIQNIEDSLKINLKRDINYHFVSGDWKDMSFKQRFDLIFTADTLYNVDYYERLHDVIVNSLTKEGVCLVASKKFYFGVGGGTMQFCEYIASKDILVSKVLKEINNGMSNIRQIIELKLK